MIYTPYTTLEEADEFVTTLLTSTAPERKAWEGLADEDKLTLLQQAMTRIESIRYVGKPTDVKQGCNFPRNGQKDVPTDVKAALALEASTIARLATDEDASMRADLQAQGVRSFSLGKLTESYSLRRNRHGIASPEAFRLLSFYMLGGAPIA